MPVYDIKLRRKDPDSERYVLTEATASGYTAQEAMSIVMDAAREISHPDYELSSIECSMRADMIMEGDQETRPEPNRSWLCRLLGCK